MCGTDYWEQGMSWFTAMECCYYNKGYLAEPQNQAEQDKIVQYITAGTVQYCTVQYSMFHFSSSGYTWTHYYDRINMSCFMKQKE